MTSTDSKTDIQRIFEAQRKNRWAIAKTTGTERVLKLKRLRQALLDHEGAIQRALYEDLRRDPTETSIVEIYPTIAELNHTIRHIKSWMRLHRVSTPIALFGTKSYLCYEAKGVVLLIAPWNYPVSLLIEPLVAAIAAGNCVIMKPSEVSTASSRLLAKLVKEVFHDNEVAVIEGDAKITQELLTLPFDHILFTGSPRVGRVVMEAAAKNLTPVTLELGGKSPVFIDEGADIRKAAERITWGKFMNAGQTCVAPDYVFVPERHLTDFCHAVQDSITKFYGATEESRKQSTDFARIANTNHFHRIKGLIEGSIREGARLEAGGTFHEKERYIAPTVLVNVKKTMPIMSEEIFGPVMPILSYRRREEFFEHVNSGEKPLALYVFANSNEVIDDVLKNTTSGGVAVNDVCVHLSNPNLPFGGVGNSGIGSYHGFFGFRAFSHERGVFHQGAMSALKLLYPPYLPRVKNLIRFIIKYLS